VLRAGEAARLVVVGAFALLFAAVMLTEYLVLRRALAALAALHEAGAALTLYVLESFLALTLLIVLASFVAAGLWIFYRAADTQLLLTAPLPVGGLYGLRCVQTFGQTVWALGVLGGPALAALGGAYGNEAPFYVHGAVVLVLFGVLAGGTGAVLTTAAGAAVCRVRTRLGTAIGVGILLIALTILVGRSVIPSMADFQAIFEPGPLDGRPSAIKFIEEKFSLWPSHPFAAELYALATGGRAGSRASRAFLWLAPVASLVLATTLGRRLYARTLPVFAEGLVFARAHAPPGLPGARPFPRRLHGPIGALIEREFLGLVRSPSELGRAAFLALLLVLYTSFVVLAPLGTVVGEPAAAARLLLFDVAAAGYFLTAFGLRFVFPAMSLEGRAAWVFFSSPIPIFRVFLAKLFLYGALLTFGVVPIALCGVLRLARDPNVVGAATLLVVTLALTTTTLALAFGAAWPNFREPNAEVLTTSGGGLALTVVCLVYVAVMGGIARRAVLAAAAGGSAIAATLGGVLLSLGLVAAAVALAYRRLRALEAG
jgi:ABC-2 type transport system permease protein